MGVLREARMSKELEGLSEVRRKKPKYRCLQGIIKGIESLAGVLLHHLS